MQQVPTKLLYTTSNTKAEASATPFTANGGSRFLAEISTILHSSLKMDVESSSDTAPFLPSTLKGTSEKVDTIPLNSIRRNIPEDRSLHLHIKSQKTLSVSSFIAV